MGSHFIPYTVLFQESWFQWKMGCISNMLVYFHVAGYSLLNHEYERRNALFLRSLKASVSKTHLGHISVFKQHEKSAVQIFRPCFGGRFLLSFSPHLMRGGRQFASLLVSPNIFRGP